MIYENDGNKVNNVNGENGGQSQQRRARGGRSVTNPFVALVFVVNESWPFFALFAFFAVLLTFLYESLPRSPSGRG